MRRFSNLDNVFILENNLSLQEGYLLEWILALPRWADNIVIGKKVYYFGSKTKACLDIPLLSKKPDTMYRYYKKLQEKGFIEVKKVEGKDYVFFTDKCFDWNSSEGSDKNPSKLGKLSENHSDKNPTYSNTIHDSIDNNSNKALFPNLEDEILDYLNAKLKSKRGFQKVNSNLKHIKARLKEKYIQDDFEKVIDYKISEWIGEAKTKVWLRPSTLFGDKFDQYLVQANSKNSEVGTGDNLFQDHKATINDLRDD